MTTSRKYLLPEVLGKISRLELRARAVVEGFVNGLHTSPYHGLAVEFAEHREYVPGDDLRHIDWRLYAKSDRYYIKRYEEETNLRSHLLLDVSGSMAYPDAPVVGRLSKWDYAATLAASLAFLQVYQQDAVGMTLYDHRVRHRLPSTSSRRQLGDIVTAIEEHAPQDTTDFGTVLRELADGVPRRSMVVVLSDLLGDVEDLCAGLGRLRHMNNEVVVLHILDQDELEFPFVNQTEFEGLELPQRLRSDPQALKRSYLRALQAFNNRMRSFCVNQRIEYALISTAQPLDVALPAFLAARMHAIRANVR